MEVKYEVRETYSRSGLCMLAKDFKVYHAGETNNSNWICHYPTELEALKAMAKLSSN
jgi:hypothetical protein